MVNQNFIEDLRYIFEKRESPNVNKLFVRKDPDKFPEKFKELPKIPDIIIKYLDNKTTIGFTQESIETICNTDNYLNDIAENFLDAGNANKDFLATKNGNVYKLTDINKT